MAKVKNLFVCRECGGEFQKWMGRCTACGAWNSLVEESVIVGITKQSRLSGAGLGSLGEPAKPTRLSEVKAATVERITTNSQELDRVLGGGIVPGSLVLIGGEPGIGKSTLVLQTALSYRDKTILYFSGEESQEQIKLRAARIPNANLNNCIVVSDTLIDRLPNYIERTKPDIVIVDSIQTVESERVETSVAGSITQIRECAALLMRLAKERHLPVLLIGHINKDGQLAGPKVLEHMVDVVLQFEGDQNNLYRVLRGVKNRFGSTNEIGIFEMLGTGLREVLNPSEMLLTDRGRGLTGVSIVSAIEGARPLMLEVQALASTAAYGTAQRTSTGFDVRRLNMLLAVLERRAGFKVASKDVFLNIAGGLKVVDTGIDLGVVASVISSTTDVPVTDGLCMAGEVGLSGEIRPVPRLEQRITEAAKLGFHTIVIPRSPRQFAANGIRTVEVGTIGEALNAMFNR